MNPRKRERPQQNKWGAAWPSEYPPVAPTKHYTKAFTKGKEEREIGKQLKDEWKALINAEFGHILPKKLLKKIANPSNHRLTS